MDDLYGNAWSQPDEQQVKSKALKSSSASGSGGEPWGLGASGPKDDEADVGQPSWSTGAVSWNEPSGEASLWTAGASHAADELSYDWGAPSDSNFSLQATSPFEAHVSPRLDTSEADEEVTKETEDSGAVVQAPSEPSSPEVAPAILIGSPKERDEAPLQLPSEALAFPSTPDSPDPFGSFETGLHDSAAVPGSLEADESWSSAVAFDSAADDREAWGSAWEAPKDESEVVPDVPKDEWELAKEHKLKRDRTVVCTSPPRIKPADLFSSNFSRPK